MAKKENPFKGVKQPKNAKPAPAPKPSEQKKTEGEQPLRNVEFTPVLNVTSEPRVGFQSFIRELQERLQDIEENPQSGRLYVIPVRLKPSQYRRVLQSAIARAQATQTPDWTEQDHLEAWISAVNTAV